MRQRRVGNKRRREGSERKREDEIWRVKSKREGRGQKEGISKIYSPTAAVSSARGAD